MEEEKLKNLEEIKNVSPLELVSEIEKFELYDKKSSQEIIDEVYKEFQTGEHMTESVLKPVFTSIIDGLLEASVGGRAARKKGLTASRVLQECEHFTYEGVLENGHDVNPYTEYKNVREYHSINPNMTQQYDGDVRKKLYEDKTAMDNYKKERVVGDKSLVDEYTGKRNLYLEQKNPNYHYIDEKHRKQAQPDHIVPIKQIHDKFKSNYAMDDSDIKRIANIEENFAVTSAEINQAKKEKSNAEYIKYMEEQEVIVDEQQKETMLKLQDEAEKAVDKKANEIIKNNLLGRGGINKENFKEKLGEFEKKNGRAPNKEEIKYIKADFQKEKAKDIYGITAGNAKDQAKEYAVGNLILFIVKPLYFEMKDIFKNGMKEGVGASGNLEALEIRFKRVKKHVLTNAAAFLGDNLWDFIKGFISSFVEGIISLFIGVFKQVFKLIKEGIKIFTQSAKILFGKGSKNMSMSQKGDAIIKLVGGSAIAISGIAIEALLNKFGIGEPWSVVLSTIFSGIASALFMYLLDKVDLFSTKAEKRKERIEEIFNERIAEIQSSAQELDIATVKILREQRQQFESITDDVNLALESDDMDSLNKSLYNLAKFFNIDLPYANSKEFVEYFDAEDSILI